MRAWVWSAGTIIAVYAYTLNGGSGLGGRVAFLPPPLVVTSVENESDTVLRVIVRNHQAHAARASVEYVVLDGPAESPAYRSASSSTSPIPPHGERVVLLELRREDAARPELHVRVRERLDYFDESQFDRDRIAPFHSVRVSNR